MTILGTARSFASLSVRDLLDARDAYHWHLINKRNVVGTAIGLYRIRSGDPWPNGRYSALAERGTFKDRPARTFDNSEIRDYSWPCVLVLVDAWESAGRFGLLPDQVSPDELVPKTLYLPDGRTVPVCVVEVARVAVDDTSLPPRTWPTGRLGGGFPLLADVQGQTHRASAGALVTDGHTLFVLTSRHVTGPAGGLLSSVQGGREVVVGRSAGQHLTRCDFSVAYPEFTARRTLVTLDAGLIEVDEAQAWTSDVFGLAPVGELADLNELNIGLRLIDAHVRAFGAATGTLTGRIAALFYRYRSLGGFDQVTDFLIAPDADSAATRPGDSGTVWHLEEVPQPRADGDKTDLHGVVLRPIALEWGGQAFGSQAGRGFNFTLAANLTTILRLLDVDLVTEHNTGAQPFWGKTGHYTIGSFACGAVETPTLKALMTANVDRVSFPVAALDSAGIDATTISAKKNGGFVPLADVPDLIWKNQPLGHTSGVKGGRDTRYRSGPEHPCHHADIDLSRPGDTVTFRQLCLDDPTNLTPDAWVAYYTSIGHDEPDDQGLLPFRVWQFFDTMTAAAAGHDLPAFLAAAGLVAHYVGDASQPLHGSHLADGLPDGTGEGIHSVYETTMIDRHDTALVAALPTAITATARPQPPATGKAAAQLVLALMDRTARAIDPETLTRAYAAASTKPRDTSPHVTDALWSQFGDAAIRNIADGIVCLASLWTGAWSAGRGEDAAADQLAPIDQDLLQALYEQPDFVPSLYLNQIGPQLSDS